MAIAFDAGSNGTAGSSASISWSHTCSGDNRLLFVHVFVIGASETITGVTYGGTAMTQVDKKTVGTNYIYLYVLHNPASGANTVQVSGSDTSYKVGAAASYTGAQQSSTMDASGTHGVTSAASPYRQSLSSVADNCWHIMACTGLDGLLTSENTERATGASYYTHLSDNNSAKTPAGSVTLGYTYTGNSTTSSIMATFAPYTASGPSNLKTVNGLAKASIKTVNGLAIASVKSIDGLT